MAGLALLLFCLVTLRTASKWQSLRSFRYYCIVWAQQTLYWSNIARQRYQEVMTLNERWELCLMQIRPLMWPPWERRNGIEQDIHPLGLVGGLVGEQRAATWFTYRWWQSPGCRERKTVRHSKGDVTSMSPSDLAWPLSQKELSRALHQAELCTLV